MSTVQRKAGPTTNGGTVTLDSNVTSGNHVIIAVLHNGATVSFTDTQSNAYTSPYAFTSLSGAVAVEHFWAPVGSSGALTITISVSGTVFGCQVYEVSGRATSPYHSLESQACGSSTTQETGAFTPPSNNCFLSFVLRTDSAPSMTGPTSFTQADSPNNGQYFFADYVQPTAASINPTVTNGGTPSVGDVYCALFTAAAGGGSVAKSVFPFFLNNGS